MATRLEFYQFNADICISKTDISFNKYRYLYFLELQISLIEMQISVNDIEINLSELRILVLEIQTFSSSFDHNIDICISVRDICMSKTDICILIRAISN